MVCSACGSPLEQEVRFCPKCGASMQAATPIPAGDAVQAGAGGYGAPPAQMPYGAPMMIPVLPRVQRHLQTLAVFWIVYGVYRVFSGLIGVFFLRAFTWRQWAGRGWPLNGGPMMPFGSGWMEALVPVIITVSLVAMALALFTGWSLLNRKPWGRVLAIVAGVLALFKFPIGTALGIYTLWVLAPEVSGAEYDAMADRS